MFCKRDKNISIKMVLEHDSTNNKAAISSYSFAKNHYKLIYTLLL